MMHYVTFSYYLLYSLLDTYVLCSASAARALTDIGYRELPRQEMRSRSIIDDAECTKCGGLG